MAIFIRSFKILKSGLKTSKNESRKFTLFSITSMQKKRIAICQCKNEGKDQESIFHLLELFSKVSQSVFYYL